MISHTDKKLKMLNKALNNSIWLDHIRNVSKYTMDDKKDIWEIVYYPIFQCGKTKEVYKEPRALVQNIDKKGFWSKEVPLRYLKPIKPPKHLKN